MEAELPLPSTCYTLPGRRGFLTETNVRQSKYSEIRNIPQRSTATDMMTKSVTPKTESKAPPSGADLPAVSMSQIDVNAIPIHKGTGKPLTQVNIDEGAFPGRKP